MVLIMDVARFKYPPHWVPLTLLYEALLVVDPETEKSRGYLLLSPSGEIIMDKDECCLADADKLMKLSMQNVNINSSNATADVGVSAGGDVIITPSTGNVNESTQGGVITETTTNIIVTENTSTVIMTDEDIRLSATDVINNCVGCKHESQQQQHSLTGTEKTEPHPHCGTDACTVATDCATAGVGSCGGDMVFSDCLQQSPSSNDKPLSRRNSRTFIEITTSSSTITTTTTIATTPQVEDTTSTSRPRAGSVTLVEDDGTKCTFMRDRSMSVEKGDGQTPGNMLSEFLAHTCKHCAKQ